MEYSIKDFLTILQNVGVVGVQEVVKIKLEKK
jgi:hypothetical protein